MTGAGYTEVINYSFVSPDAVDQLGLAETDERRRHVRIRNPLTEEQAVMRTTMIYSLLLNARRNADCGRFDLKIFEMGKTFIRRGEGNTARGNRTAWPASSPACDMKTGGIPRICRRIFTI